MRSVRGLALVAAVAGALTVIVPGAAPGAPPAGAAEPMVLPFDMPSTATLRSSPHKVYAHYFTTFPQSIDNKDASIDYWTRHYLDINGENGKHAAYGGLTRERPLPRPPITVGDWGIADMVTEVRRATAAGIDGFTVDMLSLSGTHWSWVNTLVTAANQVDPDFDIVLMPDSTTSTVNDKRVLAAAIAGLADEPSVAHLPDGRLVVAPFAPERVGAAYWQEFIAIMHDVHGIDVALVPTFVNYGASAEAFAPFSYGLSSFGARNPNALRAPTAQANDAHARGKLWMQPVSVQDMRPRTGVYDEANNTEVLRTTWTAAIDGGAEWVNLVTWNDYGEHTEFSPSTHTGWGPLDISAYYLTWFKTGAPPAIVRDGAYLTHRIQFANATPASGHPQRMGLRAGSSPARDAVEVLSFLAAPATVTVTIGSQVQRYSAPAGVSVRTVPLALGSISMRIDHSDGTVTTTAAPFAVLDHPWVQDLQYYFVSSLRQGQRVASSGQSPVITAPPTTTASPTTTAPATTSPPTPAPPTTVAPTAPTAAPAPPASTDPSASTGLIGSWSLDESAGSVAVDTSPNRNDGQLLNGVSWAAGRSGNATLHSGTPNQQIRIPDSASLQTVSAAMTISAWVRADTVSASKYLTVASRQYGTSYGDQWYFALVNGYPTLGVNTPSGGNQAASGPTRLAVGQWVHLTGTYDGTTIRLYVNGTQVGSRAKTGKLVATKLPLIIGGNQNDAVAGSAQDLFRGLIDSVRLYDRALTATQVAALANDVGSAALRTTSASMSVTPGVNPTPGSVSMPAATTPAASPSPAAATEAATTPAAATPTAGAPAGGASVGSADPAIDISSGPPGASPSALDPVAAAAPADAVSRATSAVTPSPMAGSPATGRPTTLAASTAVTRSSRSWALGLLALSAAAVGPLMARRRSTLTRSALPH